jgi:hypothetical protein
MISLMNILKRKQWAVVVVGGSPSRPFYVRGPFNSQQAATVYGNELSPADFPDVPFVVVPYSKP